MQRSSPRLLSLACAATLALILPATASAKTDPLRSQQWALGAVHAPQAWAKSTGGNVVVAVIDSGIQADHPDLADSLWRNPDEVVNGRDDDGNGYVDDVHGANVLDGSGDVADDEGHGTAVAGIIAAR